MRLNNTTNIPNDIIRKILNHVKPANVKNFDVEVKNSSKLFYGRAYYAGSAYHATCSPFIVLRIGTKNKYPMPPVKKRPSGYLPLPWFADKKELLLYLSAHELRHLWQSKIKRGWRVWGSRGQFSERDADAYALRKLREWRIKQ